MKLSDTEKQMVARIRKQEASLVRWRWLLFLGGFLLLAIDGYCGSKLIQSLAKPDLDSVMTVALLSPFVVLSAAFAGGMIGYIERCWNGSPERQLLLRIIDELQTPDA